MRKTIRSGALFLALLGAVGAEAQEEGELSLRAGRVADERGVERGGVSLASSLRWAGTGSGVALGVRGTLLDGGGVLGGSGASGWVVLAEAGRVGLLLAGTGSMAESTGGYRALAGRVTPRVVVGSTGWGVAGGPYLGGGGERVGASSSSLPLFPDRRSDGMEWRGVRGASVEGWLEGESGVLRAGWTEARSGEALWRDLRAEAAVRLHRLSVGAEAGVRRGEEGEGWGAANAALSLGGGTALTAEVGRYPSDPLTGRAAGRFASLGVRHAFGGAPETNDR